ncbi:uncharacterized protein N7515_007582 [Penicillium bovifimosum]|uniref:NACHT domain-containing protein n=1 Tax=Penicillium bovifimosum TaxID=126998 RepID=A0A9W9GX97_9EURO|nr:uncharacterized protein N7515_007582 [Penicillium bovifimosum]KAJ5131543.1 hypothetical protein N7515_007582 [Penicillium bovifimosum]
MSFGLSFGDLVSVVTLANKLRKDFVGAPIQFNSISREVRTLAIILQDVDVQQPDFDMDDHHHKQLEQISHSCWTLLKELEVAIGKYKVIEYCGTSLHKKARSIWKRISWEPKEIAGLRDRLLSNVTLLRAFLNAVSSQTMAATKKTLEQLNQRQGSHEDSFILDWLTPVDYACQQSDFLSRRQAGTGQWLLASKEYTDWLHTRQATLFCPGIPGAGKTICSAIVIDDLTTRFEDNSDVGIAYIYCNYNRQDEQDAPALLLSLLKQLAQRKSSVPDVVKELHRRYKTTSTRPQFGDISKALHSVASTYSYVFIVVDALDECQSTCRARFLAEIMKMRDDAGLNILATSRPTEIYNIFKGGSCLEIRANDDDVRQYLEGNMFRLPGFVTRNLALQEEIIAVVSGHVQGMFLLAQLHFESLIGRRSAKSVRAALRELSQGCNEYAYDDAYDKAIKRIQGQFTEQTELAIQTLSWLTCARRPLNSLELQHALAIERGESALDEENISEIEDIIAVCAGLVTVENESGIIRLAHYTTREYLERKKPSIFPNAENEISSLCVTYLSFDIFGSGSRNSDEAFEARLRSYPFYSYAADHWGDHVRLAGDLQSGVIEFLLDEPKVEAAVQAKRAPSRPLEEKNWSQKFPKGLNGFHLAALFGIEAVVTYFLEQRYPVDQTDNRNWTPLMYAISYDQLNVPRILLSHGANPNGAADDESSTPLSIAAKSGQNITVRLLLEKGADVDGPCGGWDGTPLISACESGQLETVEILLQSNANINAESEMYASPLEAAAQAGHWEVVTFLLEKGADPDSQKDGVETALQAAAYQGQRDMVLTLLNYHADINREGGMWGTALIAACVGQHEEIVRLLLDNGADINAAAGGHGTALQAASKNGDQKLVKMLLENGANVNAEHGQHGTALIVATTKGEFDTVKLLLDNGADVHGRGRIHGTALHAAAGLGNVQIVQLLLARGADSTIRAGIYKTPLRAAALRGHQGVASILKSQGQPLKV